LHGRHCSFRAVELPQSVLVGANSRGPRRAEAALSSSALILASFYGFAVLPFTFLLFFGLPP
jgi:hypothetical protein